METLALENHLITVQFKHLELIVKPCYAIGQQISNGMILESERFQLKFRKY